MGKSNPLLEPAAVDKAREAVAETGEGGIGKHLGVGAIEPHVVTHRFAASVPGYRGWEWQVVLACAEGSRDVTINEIALLPGEEALRAPKWVPYSERVRPEDLGPGDIMPPAADDPRLSDGELTEVGLRDAKERWRAQRGPNTPMAAQAQLQCRTCAFFLPLVPQFGVCANKFSADGQVVHGAYGCGAHSATKPVALWAPAPEPYDDESPIF